MLGNPTITCPMDETSSLPVGIFERPTLSNFPNDGSNVLFTYMARNPPVTGEEVILMRDIPYILVFHQIPITQLGTNEIIVTATDSTTNPATTATCTFIFRRIGELDQEKVFAYPKPKILLSRK